MPSRPTSSVCTSTVMLGVCSMRRMRYFDIVSMRPEPLTTMYTCFVLSAKKTAACPAEFPPPTTMMSSPLHTCFNKGCTVINADAFKAGQILNGQLPIFGPGGDDDRARWDLGTILEFYLIRLAVAG